jgi:raffinose/stachyose/melibiose transport system substrate-binding protein
VNTAVTSRRRGAWMPIVAGLGASALLLTGCSAGNDSTADAKEFSYLSFTENTAIADTLTSLSTGACKAENDALPLKITNQPQASYDQQLQLLAGQKSLPSLFASGNTPQVGKDLAESGQLVDIGAALTDLGVADSLIPAAGKAIESLYGSAIGIPTELNIEGIWYNKAMLAENNVTPPTTWDELVDGAATLDAAGVTPFAAAGKDGWPLTRLVGSYIYRTPS